MKLTLQLVIKLSFIGIVLSLFSSCVRHKQLVNFKRESLSYNKPEDILNLVNIKIQPEDLLQITVHSFDPDAARPFNLDSGKEGGTASANNLQMVGGNALELFSGYFVDQTGFVDFPVLGRVQVVGMTLEEAKFKLIDLLKPYLKDAVVNMRFLNFKITVLGEVNMPGTIRLTNKRLTVLEALGLAGDMTSYANRANILIVREVEGKRTFERLNLQDNSIFISPFFYLMQNDVIYIEPLPAKTATTADLVQRIISYVSGGLSLVTLILTLSNN